MFFELNTRYSARDSIPSSDDLVLEIKSSGLSHRVHDLQHAHSPAPAEIICLEVCFRGFWEDVCAR